MVEAMALPYTPTDVGPSAVRQEIFFSFDIDRADMPTVSMGAGTVLPRQRNVNKV